MAERAAELGGTLEVTPGADGRGTLLLVAIPVVTAEPVTSAGTEHS